MRTVGLVEHLAGAGRAIDELAGGGIGVGDGPDDRPFPFLAEIEAEGHRPAVDLAGLVEGDQFLVDAEDASLLALQRRHRLLAEGRLLIRMAFGHFRGTGEGRESGDPRVSQAAGQHRHQPVALGFGALYAGVLLLAAWLSEYAGSAGLLALAAVSGLADVDAITLSSLRLFDTGALSAQMAAYTIGCAFAGATAFKLAVVAWVGGRGLARQTLLALVAPVVGTAFGLWLFASA